MNRKWASITLTIILVTTSASSMCFAEASAASQQQKQQPKSEGRSGGASLTGCIDEQDGHYVLVDDRTLTPVANLEADGFPAEGFAKHLGHKVTVRGMSSSGSGLPIFKVRTVETVSETCAPKQ
jgi:hypothetical protein